MKKSISGNIKPSTQGFKLFYCDILLIRVRMESHHSCDHAFILPGYCQRDVVGDDGRLSLMHLMFNVKGGTYEQLITV